MTEHLPFSEVRKPSAGETVDWDLTCARCRYNLRTMAFDGACPECGRPVRESLLDGQAVAVMAVGLWWCGLALAVWPLSWWLAICGYVADMTLLIFVGLWVNAAAKWWTWYGEMRICSPAALVSLWPTERRWFFTFDQRRGRGRLFLWHATLVLGAVGGGSSGPPHACSVCVAAD